MYLHMRNRTDPTVVQYNIYGEKMYTLFFQLMHAEISTVLQEDEKGEGPLSLEHFVGDTDNHCKLFLF